MKATILLATLIAFSAASVHAQSLEEMMKKAMEQSKGEGRPTDGTQVTVEENNDPFSPLGFTGSYRMEVHSFKNGTEEKDSPMFMRMAFKDDGMAMVPQAGKQKEEMRMVYDLRNKFTYTLITDEKGKRTGMKMKMMKVNVEGASDQEGDMKVERTNETKVIAGHTCRKYTYSDKDGNGEAWIAEDVNMDMGKAFGQMVGGKRMESWQKVPYGGLMMESTWNSADGKEKVQQYTRDLVVGRTDEALFSTDGYEIQDMSAFPMFGK